MLSDLTSSSSNDDIYVETKMETERVVSPDLPIIIKREQKVDYKTLLIPNGMRSSYWKYFGFPSADGRTYLTKQKVVCALCNALLAYNKNTTNLKSHLTSRHRDVIKKSDLIIQSKKNGRKIIKEDSVNVKAELASSMSPTSSTVVHDSCDGSTGALIDDLEFEPGEIPEPNETDNLFIIDEEEDSCNPDNLSNELNEIQPDMMNITSSRHSIVDESNLYMTNLMTSMIITDLLPISTTTGAGFENLMNTFLPQPIPKTFEIESHINYLWEKRKLIVQNFIRNITKNTQFSIILNKFKTYTHQEFIMAIINFVNIGTDIQKCDIKYELGFPKIEQKTYVYSIVHIRSGEVDYDELFANLNLSKCISIIINYSNHSSLIDFLLENNLNNNKIVVVPNFLDIIKNLVKNIFYSNNSGIDKILKQICDTSSGNNNWYNRWLTLENYFTRNSNNDDELTNLVGLLIECLRPLQVTLDLLQNEDIIPNASLIKPLIMQLLENHFKLDFQNDHTMIHEIKEMVNKELNSPLTDSPILSVLSFLDPRFTHLLTSSEIEYVREFLREKLEENVSYEHKNTFKKVESVNKPSTSTGLEYFFILKNPKSTVTNKFDHELDNFMKEDATSLEQCPISWWSEYGYFYPSLSQLAKMYTNIPACYLEQHKIGTEEYFKFHKKRFLLDECTEKILYLHLTEEYPPCLE